MAMKVRVKWVEDRTFLGFSGSGHAVALGTAMDGGAKNSGNACIRPMEMVLLGMGGCTAYDVIDILVKSRQPVEDCVVELEAERAETIPRVFVRIHVRYIVSGRGLSSAKVERAVTLSAEKYCSATLMLAKTAEITHEIEIVDLDAQDG